jgi:hypothetical protein
MDIPTSQLNAPATPAAGRPEALWGAERLQHLRFPPFKHAHPAVLNINKAHEEHQTLGNRIADQVVATVGSWRFIITQSIILLAWVVLNSVAWAYAWDPRPFILLNLALSFEAAYCPPRSAGGDPPGQRLSSPDGSYPEQWSSFRLKLG